MSNHLSLLVHCYFLAALAYNVASQALHDMTGRKLAPTDPVIGILFISLVYLVYLLKPYLPLYPFSLLMFVLLAMIVRFGVIQHLLNYSPHTYHSRFSWLLAVLINVFGCIVLPIALFYPGG